jgi:hypothetical protein
MSTVALLVQNAHRMKAANEGAAHPDLIRSSVFKGVDFNAVAAKFWGLKAMRADKPLPKIRWCALSQGTWSSGRAFVCRGRITVRLGPGCSIERAAETLLHEMVHMACPKDEHHGEMFRRRLIACAREAFDLLLDTAALLDLGTGKYGTRAYAIDAAIVQAMEATNVGDDLLECAPFTAPPPETDEQIACRRAAVIAARAAAREAHARAKLAQWERRLDTAKQLASKWRAKVRGYERRQLIAAKKGK